MTWLPSESGPTAEAAVAYATNGWSVFPCKGKQPITSDGFKGASALPEAVQALWARDPQANVGWAVPGGWFALDVDPRHGGDVSLLELQREHGPLPWTLRARTGGGGEHWIYRIPAGVELRQMAGFRPGLDTRMGGRGYLLIAPSIHPETKQAYRWHTCVEPTDPPGWLVDLIKVRPVVPRAPYVPPVHWTVEQDRRRKYGIAALKGCAEEVRGTGDGGRNNALNKAWFRMLQLRDAVPVDEIRDALTSAALDCGLSEYEISKVLR
jgi:hypothetical protein